MEPNATTTGDCAGGLASERALPLDPAAERRAALSRLYQAHSPAVAGYVRRRVGDAHTAEDLAAEVFVRAFESLDDLSANQRARAWLFRVATNLVNRWARRRRIATFFARTDVDPQSLGAADAVHPLETAAEAQLVRSALLALPPRYQAVLTLHYVEGMEPAEVAEILGCAPGTVHSRLSRGRERLRKELEKRTRS